MAMTQPGCPLNLLRLKMFDNTVMKLIDKQIYKIELELPFLEATVANAKEKRDKLQTLKNLLSKETLELNLDDIT